MLQFIISNKVQKSKQNIEAYLSNTQPPNPRQSQNPSSSAPRPPAPTPSTNQSTGPKKLLAKNQIQLKLINIGGKVYSKQGMLFRFSKQESRFEFVYEEEGVRTKLQGKREALQGKKVKPNYGDGSCLFEIKQAMFKKQDTKQSAIRNTAVWSNGKQVNQQNVIVNFKDKQQLKLLMQTSFMQGLVDTATATGQGQSAKNGEVPIINQQGNQLQQDHANIKLSMPTPAQQPEVQRIRKTIKQMKQQEKNTVLLQIFKIKKQYQDPNSMIKKLCCPIHFCQKSYKDIQQLKSHLKQKHPQLSKHGIQLSQYDGTFEYGSKAMDLALFIGKMFPGEMKKIIKQTKTTKTVE